MDGRPFHVVLGGEAGELTGDDPGDARIAARSSYAKSGGSTQDQLAGACQRLGWDVSRVTITKIETGARAVNDGEVVVLASVLKSTPDWIDFLQPFPFASSGPIY